MRQTSLELGAILKPSALGVLNTFIHFQIIIFLATLYISNLFWVFVFRPGQPAVKTTPYSNPLKWWYCTVLGVNCLKNISQFHSIKVLLSEQAELLIKKKAVFTRLMLLVETAF